MGRNQRVAKRQAPARPYVELGGSGLRIYGGIVDEELLRQLKGERLIRAMREMSENDEIVGAMLYALEMLIRQASWTVEPASGSREDAMRAKFLESVPEDMSHSWGDFVGEWMASPVFGFAPFETVYKRRQGTRRSPGESSRYADGRIGVRKLAIRHPDTLVRWLDDPAGGIQGMEQQTPDGRRVSIPIEKMLLFRVRSRKGNPEGLPLIRNAYPIYVRKKRLQDVECIGIERNLAGLPVMYVPPHWMMEGASAADQALLEEAKRTVRNIRVDEQAGLVLPSQIDPDSGERVLKLELLSMGGGKAVQVGPTIERYNRGIAMTILADVILLGHEKVGSYSLASSKTNLFAAGIGALLDGIAETLNRHLVPRLWALNGWPLDSVAKFTHGDIESVDLVELGDYIAKLAGSGMPLFPSDDGEIERYLLRAANLPDTGIPIERAQEMAEAAAEGLAAAGEAPEDEDEDEEEQAA